MGYLYSHKQTCTNSQYILILLFINIKLIWNRNVAPNSRNVFSEYEWRRMKVVFIERELIPFIKLNKYTKYTLVVIVAFGITEKRNRKKYHFESRILNRIQFFGGDSSKNIFK